MQIDVIVGGGVALAGAMLGAIASLIGQRATMRHAERINSQHRQDAIRAERRALIMDYYAATQEVEEIAGDRDLIDTNPQAAARVTHRLWVCHKRLALVASEDLTTVLNNLSDRLNAAVWDGLDGQRPHEFIRAETHNFMTVAQREAGPINQ